MDDNDSDDDDDNPEYDDDIDKCNYSDDDDTTEYDDDILGLTCQLVADVGVIVTDNPLASTTPAPEVAAVLFVVVLIIT